MKILVTGGAGFIGSHIVEHFQGVSEIRVLDNLRSGSRRNLDSLACEFIEGSILDRNCVREAVQEVDYVFHLAALTSVPESVSKPVEYKEVNVIGTLVVLEEAAKAGVKKLVFSSSAAVYGDNPVIPNDEALPPQPKSPYAITKLEGERYCKLFADGGHLPTVCLRYFNVFGPRQNPENQYAAAVPIFIRHALRHEPITIYGDGEQTRDFVFVKDIAAANAFFAMQSPAGGVFNVAYGHPTTINELATTICRLTNSRSVIKHVAERAGDVRHSLASVKKLLAAGFKPQVNLSDGLKATVDFYRKYYS